MLFRARLMLFESIPKPLSPGSASLARPIGPMSQILPPRLRRWTLVAFADLG